MTSMLWWWFRADKGTLPTWSSHLSLGGPQQNCPQRTVHSQQNKIVHSWGVTWIAIGAKYIERRDWNRTSSPENWAYIAQNCTDEQVKEARWTILTTDIPRQVSGSPRKTVHGGNRIGVLLSPHSKHHLPRSQAWGETYTPFIKLEFGLNRSTKITKVWLVFIFGQVAIPIVLESAFSKQLFTWGKNVHDRP